MNEVMKAITKLCNMQRDKHLKQDQKKEVVRKGSGFDEILRKERERKGGDAICNKKESI